MQFQRPKGTEDFYPEDMDLRKKIFDAWNTTARIFGFEEFDGPIFEHLELFTKKSGEEIVKQLYNFKDKGERDLAIRPEMTPTLARMIIKKGASLKKPVKWYCTPRVARYERAQRGRLREFFQFNMDILGEDSIVADAEIIAAAVYMVNLLGLSSKDVKVRINSRKLMKEVLLSFGVPEEKLDSVYLILDRRSKLPVDALNKLYLDSGIEDNVRDRIEKIFSLNTLDQIKVSAGDNEAVASAVKELQDLIDLLSKYGLSDYIVFDSSIVRGLAYYTGIVYELFDAGKTLRALAGGGRYDNLIKSLGGEDLSAVGFGMGYVVLGELLQEKNMITEYIKGTEFFIVNFNREDIAASAELCSKIRAKGLSAEFSLSAKKLNKQLAMASNNGAKCVVFIGGEESDQGKIKVKDMKKGSEETLTEEEFLKNISIPL